MRLLLALCAVCAALPLFSQSDDAPNWVELMKDGELTYSEIVALHDQYWEGKEITRGSGWKPFKRWQAFNEPRVQEDGRPFSAEQLARAVNDLDLMSAQR
ncbi:MAG: hypothetical protein HKN32_00040, partial [Flavobacteriales bacterium]|nr:hypothetical protein [Flavobacteriales bacterium]